jgi:hypothetical protein
MFAFLTGRCRSCHAPVSAFALSCQRCGATNQPNPVATLAAFSALLVIAGATALGVYAWRGRQTSATNPAGPPAASAQKPGEYDWILQAMAECEAEAKQKTDTLSFLIVPMTTTGVSLPGWAAKPISSVGNSGALLNSTDALFGLRNHVLVLYDRPIAFAVEDPATDTIYKWKPAVGVSSLKTRQTGFENLKLGFQMSETADQIEWGPTVAIDKGSCYWIMALFERPAG